MKNNFKVFIGGFIAGAIGLTTVFAAGNIISAEFNSNQVMFKGRSLDLSNSPMVSIVREGEDNATNYMPVRAVLEQMGYTVNWNGNTNTVEIIENAPKVSEEFSEWINEMHEYLGITWNDFPEIRDYLNYIGTNQGVDHATVGLMLIEDLIMWLNNEISLLDELWESLFE